MKWRTIRNSRNMLGNSGKKASDQKKLYLLFGIIIPAHWEIKRSEDGPKPKTGRIGDKLEKTD